MNWASCVPGDLVMSTRAFDGGVRDFSIVIARRSLEYDPHCVRITTIAWRAHESYKISRVSTFLHPQRADDFDPDVTVMRSGTIIWGSYKS